MTFSNLGLAVIDEQHKFGVEQRKKLIQKGNYPNILAMTATPIPRTLAFTLHGEMEISWINEMPKNRQTIDTKVIPEKEIIGNLQARASINVIPKDSILAKLTYTSCML